MWGELRLPHRIVITTVNPEPSELYFCQSNINLQVYDTRHVVNRWEKEKFGREVTLQQHLLCREWMSLGCNTVIVGSAELAWTQEGSFLANMLCFSRGVRKRCMTVLLGGTMLRRCPSENHHQMHIWAPWSFRKCPGMWPCSLRVRYSLITLCVHMVHLDCCLPVPDPRLLDPRLFTFVKFQPRSANISLRKRTVCQ